VSAEIKGFQKGTANNVTVDVQQKSGCRLALPVGQSIETVTVDAAPPALQTQEASVGQVVEAEAINALPLNGRNFTFLAQLSAGLLRANRTRAAWARAGVFPREWYAPLGRITIARRQDNNTNPRRLLEWNSLCRQSSGGCYSGNSKSKTTTIALRRDCGPGAVPLDALNP